MSCSPSTPPTSFNENYLIHEKTNLPSPPNSSCGDEREPESSHTQHTAATTDNLSENYTIDHSKLNAIEQKKYTLTIQKDRHQVLPTNAALSEASASFVSSSLKRPLSSSSSLSSSVSLSDEDTSDIDLLAETQAPKRKRPVLSDTHRCNDCGKMYKHLKSLFKHQWEHSEYWEATCKLSLSKHQQVQVLEAALILSSMKNPERACNKSQNSNEDYRHNNHNNDDFEEEEEDEDEEISLM